uniref:Uncharacterized protein n=1 Tax=Kwoniella dejecticola CBS 10117 TaxID=1296121 RepID=A0A1A5ZZA3_9TREE|nr:uncharacterized protein I303_06669 [Kwoniella dejecticola CBS 10117]OBR83110.1 hypothetical protein I303_06669 [Kwoniella dejecticola CBS 10117]
MGAAQSSQNVQDQVILPSEPSTSVEGMIVPMAAAVVIFSPSLISRLSSPSSAGSSKTGGDSPDDIIRRRLHVEAENLRAKEAEILNKISSELEKENLDKEKPGMSSEILGKDIEQIREKVQRLRENRVNEGKGVTEARKEVVGCYL